MEKEELKEKIKEAISVIMEIEPEELEDDKLFSKYDNFDSIMAIDVLTQLERTFKIKISEDRLSEMSNLANTVEIVYNIVNKN